MLTDLIRHFFSERTVIIWNKSDEDVVFEPSINILKNKLNKRTSCFHDLARSSGLRGQSQSPGAAHTGELLPNTVAGLEGPLRGRKRRGKEGGGKERMKGRERTPSKVTFW